MTTVALISPDEHAAGAVAQVNEVLAGQGSVVRIWPPLELAGDDPTVGCPVAEAARTADAAGAAGAEVVCLGPGLSELAALTIARELDRRYPTVASVIVSAPTPTLWDGAMRAGVRGLLAPGASQDDWKAVLTEAADTARRRACSHAVAVDPPQSTNRVIVVLSPKGGSGKTTVSVNLAAALALRDAGEVALLDLDLQFGDVASSLQLAPAHTMVDVAHAAATLDTTTLKVFLTPHSSGLWVLAAPDTPAAADEVHPEDGLSAIQLLRDAFPTVVVDTGSGLDEATLGAIELATDLVFVTSMDVSSVRGLRKLLDVIDELGIDARRHVVLNRADAKVGIDIDDIARSLGTAIDVTIPASSRVALAANQGLTVVESDSRSPVSRQVALLTDRFVPEHATGERAGWLRRWKD